MKFATQENLIPGKTFSQKMENLASYGYEGVELRGTNLAQRVQEIQEGLKDSGISATAICGGFTFGFLDHEKEVREQSIREFKELLALSAEVGATDGVILVPIFGPPKLPDLSPWKTVLEVEEELLVEELEAIAQYAGEHGTKVILEPLNRYETHYLNRLEQAVHICERVNSKHMTILADFFHMNIEEADIARSIREAKEWIGYVHLADSNRILPGLGHTDFQAGFSALQENNYTGWMSLECGVPEEAEEALRNSLLFMQKQCQGNK